MSAAPPAGGCASIRSATRPSSAVSGIGRRRRAGHAFQHDLVGGSAVVDEVGCARPVLLQMDQGAHLECVRGHRRGSGGFRDGRCAGGARKIGEQRSVEPRRDARGGDARSPHGDRRQHQHRDADVPVRDARREHDDEHNEAGASDAAGRPRACRPRGGVASRRSRSPPRTLPEVDAPDRTARAILAPPAAGLPAARGTNDNVPVPERETAAPLLTDRFAAAFALAWECPRGSVPEEDGHSVHCARDVGVRARPGARRRRGCGHRRAAP